MTNFTTAYLCLLVLIIAPGTSHAQTVFATNYDVLFTIADGEYSVQSRARVRDGHVIPIEFQRYRLNLKISSLEADTFETVVSILERIDGHWLAMDVDPGRFHGRIGTPVQFSWNGDDIRLDIAIIVSNARQ